MAWSLPSVWDGLSFSSGGGGGSGVGLTVQTLTYDATSVTWDLSDGGCATLTLTGNVAGFANPTGGVDGQLIVLEVIQGGAGSYVISSWGADIEFAIGEPPVLSTSVGSKDTFYGHYNDGKLMLGVIARGVA